LNGQEDSSGFVLLALIFLLINELILLLWLRIPSILNSFCRSTSIGRVEAAVFDRLGRPSFFDQAR